MYTFLFSQKRAGKTKARFRRDRLSPAIAGLTVLALALFAAGAKPLASSGGSGNAGGLIGGQFQSTPTGAATFQVPISVPPGIQGLQPSLALVYSSQAPGSGPLGVGWNLSGLSAITRCGQTIPVDGKRTGVAYDASDRLCLDGMRLVARQDYSDDAGYWSGQTYSKQVEDWSEIVPTGGSCAGAPCAFEAHLADGRVLVYGGSSDAKVLTANYATPGVRPIRQWQLKEMRGRNSANKVVYNYTRYGNREIPKIASIEYSGRKIEFDYEVLHSGGAVWTSFFDGTGETNLVSRISKIRVSTVDGEYKRYGLTYAASALSGRSQLKEITECAGSVCLDPISLKWHSESNPNATDGRFRVVHPSGAVYQSYLRFDPGANIIPGDFNGDGKTDFFRQEKGGADDDTRGTFSVYFSKGDGYFKIVSPGNGWARDPYQDLLRFDPGAKIIPGDYNGDGKTDFIRQEKGGWDNDEVGTFKVYFSKGDGYFNIVTPSGIEYQRHLRSDNGANIIPGDYNGDGKTDFIRQEKGGWDNDTVTSFAVYFSRGDGYFDIVRPGANQTDDPYQDWLRADPGAIIHPGDFNGDGMTDFIRQEDGGWATLDHANTFSVYLSNGDGTFDIVIPSNNGIVNDPEYSDVNDRFQGGSWMHPDFAKLILGDFNGDGKTDFIRQPVIPLGDGDPRSSIGVYLSIGNGDFRFFSDRALNLSVYNGSHLIPLDYNGDGRTDFLRREWDTENAPDTIDDERDAFYIYVSRGDGFFDEKLPSGNAYQSYLDGNEGVFLIPGDYDGDGRSDFLRQEHSRWDDDTSGTF